MATEAASDLVVAGRSLRIGKGFVDGMAAPLAPNPGHADWLQPGNPNERSHGCPGPSQRFSCWSDPLFKPGEFRGVFWAELDDAAVNRGPAH